MKAKIKSLAVVLSVAWMFSCGGESQVDLTTIEFEPNPLVSSFGEPTGPSLNPEFTACFIDGERLLYRFGVMDRLLSENGKLRELAGFSSTEGDCARGYRLIQAKRYLSDLRHGDSEVDAPEFTFDGAPVAQQPIENGFYSGIPWAVAVGRQFSVDEPTSYCSGFTIRNGFAVTNAHCVVEVRAFNVWTDNLDRSTNRCLSTRLSPGRQGFNPCQGNFPITRYEYHPDYTGNGDDEDDIAIVTLPGGWADYPYDYPLIARNAPPRDESLFFIDSYGPTECVPGIPPVFRNGGKFKVDDVDRRDIEYDMDDTIYKTCNGDSGSVLSYTSADGRTRRVFAIHSSSSDKANCGKFKCSRGRGQATRLWEPKSGWIEGIIGQCREFSDYAECWHGPVRRPRPPRPPPPDECANLPPGVQCR